MALTTDSAFPINPVLTGIALRYRNLENIADIVMPRTDPITAETFKYWSFKFADRTTIPNTMVGRRSRVNEVEFSAAENTASTLDYGLELPIPSKDQSNAPPAIDVTATGTEFLKDLIDLDREVRVSNIVFNPATYPAANKTTLSGSNQWSDPTSDPILAISQALDGPMIRPNVMALGQKVWTTLTTHPKINSALNASGSTSGRARRQAVAELFELDDIVVGRSYANSAKPGQTAVQYRIWGNHAALLRVNPRPNLAMQVPTFGMTVPYGEPVAMDDYDKDIGLRGGTRVRVGESVAEVVMASELGYFFQNAVA